MIVYKEGHNEIPVNPHNHKYSELELDACNAINKFFNFQELSKCPNNQKVKEVLNKVKSIQKSIVKIDTIEYNYGSGGEDGVVHYLDSNNKTVKKESFSVGEHGSYVKAEYYEGSSDKMDLLYSTYESENWVGNMTWDVCIIIYYKNGKAFRKDKYDSQGVHVAGKGNKEYFLHFVNLEGIVPKIEYID